MQSKILLAFCLAAISRVNAHGVITQVQGANGVMGAAFGMDESTSRTGTGRDPFQQDSSIIRDREIAAGTASSCGRTLLGGVNDISSDLSAAESKGLASVGADGTVRMTLHQVNADGGGPYTCDVNMSADGQNFVPMRVVEQIPGKNSRSRARAEDIPLVATLPAGAQCTGGADGATCIVRCRNAANAGPFGGCVPVTQSANPNKKRDLSAEERLDQMTKQAELAEMAEETNSPISKRATTADQRLDEMIRQAEAAEYALEEETTAKSKRALKSDQRLDQMIRQAELAEMAQELRL